MEAFNLSPFFIHSQLAAISNEKEEEIKLHFAVTRESQL